MVELTKQELIEKIPTHIVDISEQLQQAGFEAFLVGGSIRDLLMGGTPADYDIATDAHPDEIEKLFAKSIPTGAQFGTMVVVVPDENGERHDVEITTYRSEADYVGGRWPAKVEFTKTIGEDLSRRDLTVNAIALDLQNFDSELPVESLFVDPYNGIKDLENKVLRAVGDPIERFTEDGLRPVRACRLAAQLGFTIEPITLAAISKTNHMTKKVSVERFRDEFMKLLLRSPQPSTGLRLMHETGVLGLFLPELEEGVGVTQPEYHTDDVFNHSLLTCDVAEDDIKLAALFHDIGKPQTMTRDGDGTHFYGHDQLGAEMTRKIMKRLRFPKTQIEEVAVLVRWHMFYYPSADWRKQLFQQGDQPLYSRLEDPDIDDTLAAEKEHKQQGGWSDGAVRRLLRNLGGEDMFTKLMKLRIADATANPKTPFNRKEIDALSDRVSKVLEEEAAFKVTDLDINGTELMQELALEPGPVLGELLDHLLEEVMEDISLNKREQLLQLARDYLANQQ